MTESDRFSSLLEARKKAMDYLARREYGRAELQHKLIAAGFEPPLAESAVERLAGEGLQDDRRFAETFVQSRIAQGKGPIRIRLELKERGIETTLVDEALTETGEDWSLLARRIRQRKFGPELPLEFRDKARQMRFLQYRGFEPDQISAAVSMQEDGG